MFQTTNQLYISNFSKKKTQNSTAIDIQKCLDCRRSAIVTLHQRLAHWRSATRPRQKKKGSHEAHEGEYSTLNHVFYGFLPTQLPTQCFLRCSQVSSLRLDASNNLNTPLLSGCPRQQLQNMFQRSCPCASMITPTWLKSSE